MIELPDGPNSPLVRGFAACLSTITQVPVPELPAVDAGAPVEHAVAMWKTWLAGRHAGLVPIADPRSFQWGGWWIAVVDGSDSPLADGPQRRVAALAFGTPPGIVHSPQDPALLSRATADLPISAAFAVAHVDAVLPPLPRAPELTGSVVQIAVAADAEAPMRLVERARAVPGVGLEGDRYARGAGTFSPRAAHRPGYELTIIAAEVVEDLSRTDPRLTFTSTRRNLMTRDIDVNALVGRDFLVGDVRCHGHRLAEPCVVLERVEGPGLLRPLIHRGGLRADVLSGGDIAVGSPVTPRASG